MDSRYPISLIKIDPLTLCFSIGNYIAKPTLGQVLKKCDQSVTLGFKNKHYVRAFLFVT